MIEQNTIKHLLRYSPIISVFFNVFLAICSVYLKDFARMVYWLLAAGLVFTTIFMR